MTTLNVSGILDYANNAYCYNGQKGYVLRGEVPSSRGDIASLKLKNSNVGTNSAVGAAIQPSTTDAPAGRRHVFFSDSGSWKMRYFEDTATSSDVDVTTVEIGESLYNVFGTATLPNGVALVGFTNSTKHNQSYTVIFATWDQLNGVDGASFSDATVYRVDPAGLDSTYQRGTSSEADCCAFMDQNGVVRIAILAGWYGSHHKHALVHVMNFDPDWSSAPTVVDSGLSTSYSDHVDRPKIFVRPDGYLHAAFEIDGDMKQYQAPIATFNDGLGDWTHLSSSDSPIAALGSMSHAFTVEFMTGDATTAPGAANSSLTDTTVPIYQAVLYADSGNMHAEVSTASYGSWKRTALPSTPSSKSAVIGIIQGPPPAPNENINMPFEYDHAQPGLQRAGGSTVYNETSASSQGFQFSFGGAFYALVEVGADASEGVTVYGIELFSAKARTYFSTTLRASFSSTYERNTVSTHATSYAVDLRIEGQEDSDYSVENVGGVLLYETNWTGYRYSYVDSDGNVPENAISFVEVFPSGEPEIVQRPYLINPSSGVTPGDLSSYFRDNEQLAALGAAAVDLGQNSTHLSISWGVNNLSLETAEIDVTQAMGFSADVSIETLVGAEGSGGILGGSAKSKTEGSIKATMGGAWHNTDKTGFKLSSSIQNRGNLEAPDTYTSYTYYTYLLRGDPRYAEDLLANLVTDDFPASGTPARAINQALKDAIAPGSAPWLITYAVTEYQKNPAVQPASA